jgi:hypothetical protein
MASALLALVGESACTTATSTSATTASSTSSQAEALPFIEDDYAKALAQARANKLPLFVDAWAPW